jgi:aspartate dehydrogenase
MREGEISLLQRKPSAALLPAHEARTLIQEKIVQKATAREICLAVPQNANIVATAALAGIGFDATQVTVIADPQVKSNSVELCASGTFGSLKLTMENNRRRRTQEVRSFPR